MSRSAVRVFTRWVVFLPVLMVGSLLYWTVALGLGGLSLMAASSLSIAPTATTETGSAWTTLDQSITVRLEESTEPEDVNDNAGSGYWEPAEDAQAVPTPGPGATSF